MMAFREVASPVEPSILGRMCGAMIHRGPDGGGIWVSEDRRVGLGHRRLSIIDLSDEAAQPMSNEDGRVMLTYNGEIYNHASIRRELEGRGGHTWSTDHSDSEVILHAYEEWGIECVDRLNGMFAFALWDGRKRELWLVRDRMGIKPLYYVERDGKVAFASEIKALLADPDQERAVNEEALLDYLTFLTTPAPTTLFKGIHKMPAGCFARVTQDHGVQIRRWYEMWDHVTPLHGLTEGEMSSRLLEELSASVQRRQVSDVPVGVFLSGGIDSSTNAALFSKGGDTRVKTFSVGYEGDLPSYRNELQYAELMAKEVGAEHHETLLTLDDLLTFLPRMVELQDEPLGDPVCVPVYYVSKLARDNGVTVCQVGEGADELFWGYGHWKTRLRAQRVVAMMGHQLAQAGSALLALGGAGRGWAREFLRRGGRGEPTFWSGADAFTQASKNRILSRRLTEEFRGRTSWDAVSPIYQRWLKGRWEPDFLNWMTYLDLNLRLPELLLMRIDKMAMGVSLEARVPFLDHQFVEFSMGIPAVIKTARGDSKGLLKKAVRGVIPDVIIDRPKQGFAAPVQDWYSGRLGTESQEVFASFLRETDLFDAARIQAMHDEGVGYRLWHLLNVALWWDRWIKHSPRATGAA